MGGSYHQRAIPHGLKINICCLVASVNISVKRNDPLSKIGTLWIAIVLK